MKSTLSHILSYMEKKRNLQTRGMSHLQVNAGGGRENKSAYKNSHQTPGTQRALGEVRKGK